MHKIIITVNASYKSYFGIKYTYVYTGTLPHRMYLIKLIYFYQRQHINF